MIPKFRAWDKDAKVMYGWENLIMEKDDRTDSWMIGYRQSPNIVEYDHEQVIMQSTGLKDKNGVEIFEGDVIEYIYGCRFEVVFKEHSFGWIEDGFIPFTNMAKSEFPKFEVIGNVFANPELLEVEGK